MPKLTTLIIFISLVLSLRAQVGPRTPNNLLIRLEKSKPDSNRIKLLLQLSDFYQARSIVNNHATDTALLYLQQAAKLSDIIHSTYWRHETFRHLGLHYFAIGDSKQGKKYFLKIAGELNAAGDKKTEIAVWKELKHLIQPRDSTGTARMTCLQRIRLLYHQLNDKENEIGTLKDIADLNMNYGKLDTAEAELQNVLAMYKAINYHNLHYTYDLLNVTNRYKGDFQKALYYALKTIESMEATKDTDAATTFYSRVANLYRELNEPKNSTKWYLKVFRDKIYKGPINLYMFRDAGFMSRELIKINRNAEALAFIQDIARKNKPIGKYASASLEGTLAFCYHALGRDDLANKYYFELIDLTKDLEKDNEVTADANYEAGQFFFDRRQFAKAGFHFKKALDVSPGINSPSIVKDIQLKLFTVDSAQGDYNSAISHLRRYQRIKDSIFNENKSRQIQELAVQYKTSQQEENIQLLNKQNQLEQISVSQANRTTNITFGGIILSFIIMGSLYYSYRNKQRTNRKLELQALEIEKQNRFLRHLVEEKEWLLKEVHHRVKNNLHTVICLLESQASYLENDAVKALEVSEHRIYAMSLIHQKLYQSADIKSIDMHDYMTEFVEYLADSFGNPVNVNIKSEIAPLKLGVSQAVPVGLILNEAVTNCFKYAFPDDEPGEIFIGLKQTPNRIELVIADNGIGMDYDQHYTEPSSLGIELMKGLTKDIEGTIKFDTTNGTRITILFAIDPFDRTNISLINLSLATVIA